MHVLIKVMMASNIIQNILHLILLFYINILIKPIGTKCEYVLWDQLSIENQNNCEYISRVK